MANVVSGHAQLAAALKAAAAKAPVVLGGAMFTEAEDIMGKSRQLAPVDRGNLRGSGVVMPPDVAGPVVQVELGYGGAASEYALVQHERLDFRHTVGQAKFLEQPVNEAGNGLEGRLAARVGTRLEK